MEMNLGERKGKGIMESGDEFGRKEGEGNYGGWR